MIHLNMFGVELSVSEGATITILPYSPTEYDTVDVVVETVRFQVSREMLLQDDEPLLKNNFFSVMIRNQKQQREINITARVANTDFVDKARLYPIIFDFLSRRIDNVDAPVHVHRLNTDDAKALAELEGFLFPDLIMSQLPRVDARHGMTFNIAIPPPHVWTNVREEHPFTTDMCMDGEFVRLVKRCKTDKGVNLDPKDAEAIIKEEANKPLLAKYKLEPKHIMNADLFEVDHDEAVVFSVESKDNETRCITFDVEREGQLP